MTLLFWACNNDARQIERVAYGYLDAMGNYRIEQAEPYAAPETIEGTLHFIEKNIMAEAADSSSELAHYIKSNTPATITINKVEILNDSVATANFTKTTPLLTHSKDITLVKRNGEWKVYQVLQIPDAVQYAYDTNQAPATPPADLHVIKKGSL